MSLNNMYYQLSEFYKRDTSFVFNEDKNELEYFDLMDGKKVSYNKVINYEVDKIDSYIDDYDILPTLGANLVSKKFKDTFEYLAGKELDFFKVEIIDKKNKINNNFYCFNILSSIPCMDENKAIVEKTKYGTIRVKKLFISPNSLNDFSIVRMQEHKSYIIVTKDFKKRCEESNLKGLEFIEEGRSIYTDI